MAGRLYGFHRAKGMLAVVLLSGSCSGLRVVDDPGPPPRERAMGAAEAAVALAWSGAALEAEDAVGALIERRIADANAVVDAVVELMFTVRRAVPRTRAVDESAVVEVDAALARVRATIEARAAEGVWRGEPHAKVLSSASALLPEVDTLLQECLEGRHADADVRYAQLIAAYDRFREDAIALAAASRSDRFAAWSGADPHRTGPQPSGPLDSDRVEVARGGASPGEGAGDAPVDVASAED